VGEAELQTAYCLASARRALGRAKWFNSEPQHEPAAQGRLIAIDNQTAAIVELRDRPQFLQTIQSVGLGIMLQEPAPLEILFHIQVL
jgi:hypothetical protein